MTEDILRAQDEAYLASLPKPKPVPIASTAPAITSAPKLSAAELAAREAERALREKWSRLIDMLGKGRLDAIKALWEREQETLGGADARIPAGMDGTATGHTLLMVAARKGDEDAVRWLLEEIRADPTLDVPARDGFAPAPEFEPAEDGEDEDDAAKPVAGGSRRTAYDLARTRGVRNVFRRCAAEHADWHDWLGLERGGARVPSVLNRDMEEGRDEKKKVRRKGLKDRVREREVKDKERAPSPVEEIKPEPPKSHRVREPVDGPRKLGGSTGAAEGIVGLTPEMRAKVERERRARAAEARMKGLGRA